MSVDVKNTGQLTSPCVKVVVYGEAGIGKTVLLATAPSPIIISSEKGLLSVRKYNLPYVEVNNRAELFNVWKWLRTDRRAMQFGTISMDGISDVAEIVLSENKRGTRDGRAAYGNTNDMIMDVLRDFRDIPDRNVYFTAKEQYVDMNGIKKYRAWMPDAFLSTQLPYIFDEIFHLTKLKLQDGRELRALHTCGDYQTMAKDRSGLLDEWEPPDLSYVFSKIAKG